MASSAASSPVVPESSQLKQSCPSEPSQLLCNECEDAPAVVACAMCAADNNNSQVDATPFCHACATSLHAVKKRRHHELLATSVGKTAAPDAPNQPAKPLPSRMNNLTLDESMLTPQEMGDMEEHDNVCVVKRPDGSLGFELVLSKSGYFVVEKLLSPPKSGAVSSINVGDVVVAVQDRLVQSLSVNQLEHLMHCHPVLRFQLLRGPDPPEVRFAAWTKLVDARRVTTHEGSKEIISLVQTPTGHFRLHTNDANIDRLFEDASLSNDKVPVVSFLGNTTAGKSFLIRALMGDGEVRPFCFDEDKMCSTTANANMYSSSHVLPDAARVNVIDFEGENGLTPFMTMIRRTKHLFHSSKDETKQRHVAVEKYFPKIAYLLSDVIVLVGDTSLVNKDYFSRCRDFAIKANTGVSETMCRPSLLIVHNKCSLTANFDIHATTREFMQAHIYDEYDVAFGDHAPHGLVLGAPENNAAGTPERPGFWAVESLAEGGAAKASGKVQLEDFVVAVNGESVEGQSRDDVLAMLESCAKPCTVRFRSAHMLNSEAKGFLDYFADVHCVRVPRGDIRQNIRGKWFNGDEMLVHQLDAIHQLLGDMTMKQRLMRRDISVGERGWFFLLRSIVAQVASEKPVSFGSLLNELLSTGDRDVDRITSAFARVYETRTVRSIEWYCSCLAFAIDLFGRMIAFNMRRKAHISILTKETVAAQAKKSLALLLTSLQRFLPCASAFPLAPAHVCGQHRMLHTSHQRSAHRTSERVPRSGNALQRWLSELDGGSHMVWEGSFESPDLPPQYFDLSHWERSFLADIHRYLFDDSTKDVALKTDELLYELLAKHTSALQLEFKVLSDNTLAHVPCIRCFKGCDAKDSAATLTVKETLLKWHTHIELIYLAPHHLGVCSCCKKYFADIGLLSV